MLVCADLLISIFLLITFVLLFYLHAENMHHGTELVAFLTEILEDFCGHLILTTGISTYMMSSEFFKNSCLKNEHQVFEKHTKRLMH